MLLHHAEDVVVAQRHALVLLLALDAWLVAAVQSVRHAIAAVHEDVARGVGRNVFRATMPGFEARLQFSGGRSRHRNRVVVAAVALRSACGSWTRERTDHWLAINLSPVAADHHFCL